MSIGELEIKDTFDKVVKKIQGRALSISTTTTTMMVEATTASSGGGRPTKQIAPSPIAKLLTAPEQITLSPIQKLLTAPVVMPCRHGARCTKRLTGCKFVHPCDGVALGAKKGGSSATAVAETCAFFAVGKCKSGKSCKYLHAYTSNHNI